MSPIKHIPLLRHLLFFFLKFIIVYAILMLPPFKKAYSNFIKSQVEIWFSSFGEKGIVLFREPKDKSNKDSMYDIVLLNNASLETARKAGQSQVQVSDYGTVTCNWYDYMLITYLVALILAVPIGWKRKLSSWSAGMVLAYAYIILMQWVFLMHWFDEYSTLQVLQMKGLTKSIIDLVYPIMVLNPGTLVFMALLIGAVVIIRKGDWEKIRT